MIDVLNKLLANTYALYLKTQNYHWNVEGIHFHALHMLFESQYTELAQAVDEIAERIRTLGAKAPGSFREFEGMKTIPDAKESAPAKAMIEDLAASHQIILKELADVLEAAHEAKDEVIVGLLIDRMAHHEKTIWMLESHLK